MSPPFPDLKGQAPLRLDVQADAAEAFESLFLTSKVRLHCDWRVLRDRPEELALFLTSKVRLHCDWRTHHEIAIRGLPFPDLKGQAPLRRVDDEPGILVGAALFLTSKVRLHCDWVSPLVTFMKL